MLDFVIFLSGQSNAQGFGGSANILDPRDYPHSQIFSYNIHNHTWGPANLWSDMGSKPPMNQCFAYHFALEYLKTHPSHRVGIIVFAFASQSLCRWTRSSYSSQFIQSSCFKYDSGDIYMNAIFVISHALHAIGKKHLDCILWHQGEADCDELPSYTSQRLCHIIKSYRTEPFGTESLPFIVGEISACNTYAQLINTVLLGFQYTSDSFTKCASTRFLQTVDNIHFSSDSHRAMGWLYFQKWLEVQMSSS